MHIKNHISTVAKQMDEEEEENIDENENMNEDENENEGEESSLKMWKKVILKKN